MVLGKPIVAKEMHHDHFWNDSSHNWIDRTYPNINNRRSHTCCNRSRAHDSWRLGPRRRWAKHLLLVRQLTTMIIDGHQTFFKLTNRSHQ